ncbi:Protein CBG24324 [Caenorhabditis briggsae]|uniref:Protein CBG24324 n=1 Tax=Caenorhabditis briggsae TaxID=6238 RepID=A8WKG6_CAEBR|nr:Protein CBG24324 [Caenorhabditis briggsae]CAP20961.1 Protein CBG24324 [Caenorhabditis briggsae]
MEVDPPNTALSPTTVVHQSQKLIKDKEKITVADGQEYLKRQREDDWIENRVARIEAQNGKLEKLRSDVKVEEAKLENLEREYKSE